MITATEAENILQRAMEAEAERVAKEEERALYDLSCLIEAKANELKSFFESDFPEYFSQASVERMIATTRANGFYIEKTGVRSFLIAWGEAAEAIAEAKAKALAESKAEAEA